MIIYFEPAFWFRSSEPSVFCLIKVPNRLNIQVRTSSVVSHWEIRFTPSCNTEKFQFLLCISLSTAQVYGNFMHPNSRSIAANLTAAPSSGASGKQLTQFIFRFFEALLKQSHHKMHSFSRCNYKILLFLILQVFIFQNNVRCQDKYTVCRPSGLFGTGHLPGTHLLKYH